MPELTFRGRRISRDRALLMAIINRTPDSFYDNGVTFADEPAHRAITEAVAQGADVIDIGGVPASPGPEVSVDAEIRRVVPTVEWARSQFPEVVISVDTYRHQTARAVCEAGADLINDNWNVEPQTMEVAAEFGAGYICAHTAGLLPRTDPVKPRYDDVVADVIAETTRLADEAARRGVPKDGIMIDPAIDFTKTTFHSLEVLRQISRLVDTGWPVLMAMSNKGVVGETLDVAIDDRLTGTLAATALCAQAGVAMFRVHQVRASRQTVEMVASITGARPPAAAKRWL